MAEDDLDQLLDEMESRFCHPGTDPRGAGAAGGGKKEPVRSKNKLVNAASDDENVDDLIEDILSVKVHEENKKQKTNSTNQQPCKISRQQYSKKCYPVYLGGSLIPFGVGTNISERACDQLRCTACDFTIVTFDDYKWDPSCDYLFFRNSVPEHSKLQARMMREKGTRAYACQCSWRSVHELIDVSSEQRLRWVCGKHSE